MAKRKERILYNITGYASWPIRRTINEAEHVARWNPWVAHEWMEEARQGLSLDTMFYFEFDSACARINARWKNKETYSWFSVEDFWKKDKEIRNPTYLINTVGDIEFDETLFWTNQRKYI